jgi:hypothetical protein
MIEVVVELRAQAVDRDTRGIPRAREIRTLRRGMQKDANSQDAIADGQNESDGVTLAGLGGEVELPDR